MSMTVSCMIKAVESAVAHSTFFRFAFFASHNAAGHLIFHRVKLTGFLLLVLKADVDFSPEPRAILYCAGQLCFYYFYRVLLLGAKKLDVHIDRNTHTQSCYLWNFFCFFFLLSFSRGRLGDLDAVAGPGL